MTKDNLTDEGALALLKYVFKTELEGLDLEADMNIVHFGLIDSLHLVRLVLEIEKRYMFKIPDSEATGDNLGAPMALAAFINSKSNY